MLLAPVLCQRPPARGMTQSTWAHFGKASGTMWGRGKKQDYAVLREEPELWRGPG